MVGYWQARFFQRQVFQVGGRDTVVIPDADFPAPYNSGRFFLEIEQTTKFEHILEKYQKYTQIFSALSEEVTPWLVIGFPDFETFNQLIADHRRAANSVAAGRPLNLYYSLRSELHNQDCKTFEDIRHLDERGNLKTDAYGFENHLTRILNRRALAADSLHTGGPIAYWIRC